MRLLLASLALGRLVGAQSFLHDSGGGEKPNVQQVLEHRMATESECTKLTGPIDATTCDYETLESVNEVLYERLNELAHTPFFRYFKVDLYRECPFWQENGFCMHRECGVTPADERDVPHQWRAATLSQVRTPSFVQTYPGCHSRDTDFCFLDDEEEGEFIDLPENPEGFTGYAGTSAHRVWNSIYDENCFGISDSYSRPTDQSPFSGSGHLNNVFESSDLDESEQCMEKRVYYKIISGMHASISTHICYSNLNQNTGEWGPNLQCFADRVAAHPERLQYIYFNTVLMLRAVARVGPYLSAYSLENSVSDRTNLILGDVVDIANTAGRFDETAMFKGNHAIELKEEFKEHFRNVSRIMDCVGCDKCRLWGKVQVTGLGAALKILFEMDEQALNPDLNRNLLSRSEVVALIQTLYRFSESLHATEKFRELWAEAHDTHVIVARAEQAKARGKSIAESISASTISAKLSSTSRTPAPPPPRPSEHADTRPATLVKLQELGRGVYRVCRRGTLGCLQIVTREVTSLTRAILNAVRTIFALSGKDQGPGSTEL